MKKEEQLFPDALLKIIPLRYHYLEKISFQDESRNSVLRLIENDFYQTTKKASVSNYRKTSKLLKF